MKAETSTLVTLVIISTIIAGEANEDSRVTQTPQLQFDQSRDRSFYSCKFIFVVQCMWTLNENHIDISAYGYTWLTGNGSNTKDCSIIAKSKYTRKLSEGGTEDKVECTGIGNGPIKVTIGDSIELQCPVTNKTRCLWGKEVSAIRMDNNYNYTQEHDCSIRIKRIRWFDLTQWKCIDMKRPVWSVAVYTLARQNQIEETTQNTTSKATPGAPLETVERDPSTTPTALVTTIIVLSTVVMIGVIWIIRQRMKKRNMSNRDNNSHHRDGDTTEAPLSTLNAHDDDVDGYLVPTRPGVDINTMPINNAERT